MNLARKNDISFGEGGREGGITNDEWNAQFFLFLL